MAADAVARVVSMSVHSPDPTPGDGDVGPDPTSPTPAASPRDVGARTAEPDELRAQAGEQPPAPPGTDSLPGGSGGGRRRRDPKRRNRQIIEWVVLIAAALVIALVIKTFLFQAFYIPSESMVPTLKVGDRVLVNKLSYHLHPVHRGDIVVFTAPPGTETAQIKDLVKRVIGLPGDTIEGRADGHIYIDGRLLKEPYLPKGTRSKQFGPERVPAHDYYVLGDNRQFSKDSTVFGPIARSKIVGRVFVRIWPLSRLGFL
jgi:signal peptidase I